MEREVLIKIASELNENKIRWGIGASVLLHLYGIVKEPDDIDIIVEEEDALKAHEIFLKLGEYNQLPYKAPFRTKHFLNYKVGNTMVDLMGAFKIETEVGVYSMIFDSEAIVGEADYHGVVIPKTALEDWFVLYQLIPGREPKVKMIEEYLVKEGIVHRNLLDRAMAQPLPENVISRIKSILK